MYSFFRNNMSLLSMHFDKIPTFLFMFGAVFVVALQNNLAYILACKSRFMHVLPFDHCCVIGGLAAWIFTVQSSCAEMDSSKRG